jgi:hypothetical protein
MILIQESWTDETNGGGLGDSGVFLSRFETVSEVYKHYSREAGRCISKVYVDTPRGPQAIGWVFQQRKKYDDSDETFLLDTWITIHTAPPVKRTEYHFIDLEHPQTDSAILGAA